MLLIINTNFSFDDIKHINISNLYCDTVNSSDFKDIPKSIKYLQISYNKYLNTFYGLQDTKLKVLRMRHLLRIQSLQYLPQSIEKLYIQQYNQFINKDTIEQQKRKYKLYNLTVEFI